jgi:23S rRNA (uridine2552-2'-O)-methyltransferase
VSTQGKGGGRRGGGGGQRSGGARSGGNRSGAERGGSGHRTKSVRIHNARSRKPSSNRWLERQLNDPYVAEAQRLGFRSRAAFKLIEIDEKAKLLRRGLRVVDLGAAPGGWTQVAVERVGAQEGGGKVIALDILDMEPVAGATVLRGDFLEAEAEADVRAAMGGQADLVLSDLSPSTTGHASTDHLRIVALVEVAAEFALSVLAPGGAFVAKVFQGGAETELLARLRKAFTRVRHIKPPSSRKASPETYLVATGFRGMD